jgi:hypothetical protein
MDKKKIIDDLVKKVKTRINEETNEGVFDSMKDSLTGLKGVWRGEGYDYFKYLSSLRRQIQTLKKLDKPNTKIFDNLKKLKQQISGSKMPDDKKNKINGTIDLAFQYFKSYQDALDSVEILITQKIN